MIITRTDTGAAIAKLDALKERLRATARNAVEDGGNRLLSAVREKLSGDVLNSRSGALLRSLRMEIAGNTDGFSACVFSDGSVPYARIQEYGGRLNIPAIAPVHARALAFAWNGRLVFANHTAAHVVDIPERSYMRTSLAELADTFADDLQHGIAEATA